MANEQNLLNGKKTQFKSGEQAAKAGAKGGIASGKAKRERKAMREALEEILSREYVEKETGDKVDGSTLIMAKAFKNALNGDMRAIEFIRDTLGEKPTEKLEVNADIEKQRNRIIELMSCKDELLTGKEATD